MEQSSSSSFPSLIDFPYHCLRMDLSWDDDVALSASPQIQHHGGHSFFMSLPTYPDDGQQKQGIDDNGEDKFEFSSPISEWDESPSSRRLTFIPTTSRLLVPNVVPRPAFKPPPLLPPMSKPCPPSIAGLLIEENFPKDFENSGSIEDVDPVSEEANARCEKLRKVKQHRLMDLLSRTSQDKKLRLPIPYLGPGRPGSIYSTSSYPFDLGKKAMNETALGIMGIKASGSFLRPAPPILKTSFPSPTMKVIAAASSPSRQKKSSLAYDHGFLGWLGYSSKLKPPLQNSL